MNSEENIEHESGNHKLWQLPPKPPDPDGQLLPYDEPDSDLPDEQISMKPSITSVKPAKWSFDIRKHTQIARVTSNVQPKRGTKTGWSSFSLFLSNIQGLNQARKISALELSVLRHHSPDISILTETHLSFDVKLANRASFQSKPSKKGGIHTSTLDTIRRHQFIGCFECYALWTMVVIEGVRVHCISVYNPCDDAPAATHEAIYLWVQHVISQLIFAINQDEYVILAGDFNQKLKRFAKLANSFKLVPVIPDDTETHRLGGHLDQIFTNLEVSKFSLMKEEFSDHHGILANFSLDKKRNQQKIGLESYYTQKSLRDSNSSIQTRIGLELGGSNIFFDSQKRLIQCNAKVSNPFHKWYSEEKMPKFRKPVAEGETKFQWFGQQGKTFYQRMEQIETFYEKKDIKQFFNSVKSFAQLKALGTPIEGLLEGESIVTDKSQISQKARAFYGILLFDESAEGMLKTWKDHVNKPAQTQAVAEVKCHSKITGQQLQVFSLGSRIFCEKDVDDAIANTNFNKALGMDCLDGHNLTQSETIKKNFVGFALQILNGELPLPKYLSDARLTMLSKSSKSTCDISDTRPILISSHITRVIEKAILGKLEQLKSNMFKVPDYQSGFKKHTSTQKNLSMVIHNILSSSRSKTKREVLCLFDLKQAFPSLRRPQLWRFLQDRAQSPEEKHILKLMVNLHSHHNIFVDENTHFVSNKGVPQGSSLACHFFNVYFHEALMNIPELKDMIEQGRFAAYADDCLVRCPNKDVATTVISGMEKLQKYYLHLNKNKSQILQGPKCLEGLSDLDGIPILPKVKYLGYQLSPVRTSLYQDAYKNIAKHLKLIQAKLRFKNPEVQKLLMAAFGRSVMAYFCTPLVVCQVWDLDKVSAMEFSHRRKVLGLSNNISNQQIKHRTAHWFSRPLANVIVDSIESQELLDSASIAILKSSSQFFSHDQISQAQQAQQKIQETIDPSTWRLSYALSAKRTITNFSTLHWCREHKTFLRGKHIDECSLLKLGGIFKDMKPTHYNEWWNTNGQLKASKDQLKKVSNFYQALRSQIADLETRGLLIPTDSSSRFPKIQGQLFEPEGTVWIKDAVYSIEHRLFFKNSRMNHFPLSKSTEFTQVEKDAAMLEMQSKSVINKMNWPAPIPPPVPEQEPPSEVKAEDVIMVSEVPLKPPFSAQGSDAQ